MRIAIYNGSIINALDTKNKYGHYINSIYNEYKMAGQNGLLFCPDCKTKVILRAGNIREPYFAHVDSERKCEYNIEKGKSNEQIKGESILYYWLNEQYKEHVFIDKKYNNRFSNVSLEYKGKIYAFNYIRNERVLNEWNKKRKDYFETGIIDLYFFSFKEFDELKNSEIQFKKTVQQYTKDNTIKMIDTDNKKLILMRFIEFFDDEDNLFYSKLSLREYNIYDVKFTLDGQLVTNFEEEYSIDYKQHEEIANNILIERIKKAKEKELKLQQLSINYQNDSGNIEKSLNKVNLRRVDELNEIPDCFVEINRDKYTNPQGLTPGELDDEVKKYLLTHINDNYEWKLGKTNPIRLLNYRYCRKYFSKEHCEPVKPHFGICISCSILYKK